MMGQETYQIVGTPQKKIHWQHTWHIIDYSLRPCRFCDGAIHYWTLVAQVNEEQAREALVKHKGDIAAAILELGSE